MQYLNTDTSRKNGWWKPLLVAALMVLPACNLPEHRNNLVCEQGGSLSTLVKADNWYVQRRHGGIQIDANDRWSTYRPMNGELCYGMNDEEFEQLLKDLAAEQARGRPF